MNPLMILTILAVAQTWPLDQEMRSSFSDNNASVEMVCKVVKTNDVYTYMYSIKNKSKQYVKFKSDIINKAMYFGKNVELLIGLDPEENVVFTLQHPDPPTETYERATVFYIGDKEKIENRKLPQLPKGFKITISAKLIYKSHTVDTLGVLPKSYIGEKPHAVH